MIRWPVKPRRIAARPARAEAPHLAMLVVLLVIAVLRPVLGPAVVQHDHHDLGAHTHVSPLIAAADHDGPGHAHEAQPGRPADPDVTPEAPGPCGPVISLFDDHSLPAGPPTVSAPSPAPVFAAVQDWARPAAPFTRDDPASPGGCSPRGPRHLGTLAATGRLIATSRALLI